MDEEGELREREREKAREREDDVVVSVCSHGESTAC